MVESVAHMATRMPDLTGLTWQIEKAMSDSTMACSHNIAESSSTIIHRTYTSQPPAFHSSRHKMSDSEDDPECHPPKGYENIEPSTVCSQSLEILARSHRLCSLKTDPHGEAWGQMQHRVQIIFAPPFDMVPLAIIQTLSSLSVAC